MCKQNPIFAKMSNKRITDFTVGDKGYFYLFNDCLTKANPPLLVSSASDSAPNLR